MEGAPSSSFLGGTSSLVILSVSIVGILSTALLLLAYYLFLTRCGLLFFWRADLVSVTVQEQPPRRSGRGLEEAAIRRIPTFRYRHSNYDANSKKLQECAVCLGDLCAGERLRLLPPCRHAFHIDCIDAWLHATATCPLCRAPVVDGPAADDIVIDIAAAAAAATPSEAAEQPPRGSSSSSSLPLRRSLSMDSSTDKRFYLALQRAIQQQQDRSSSGSFFSFSQSRGSRSAILPL
ncbi:unnamed protein product [Urochloa decumbens]|uniref:RING-type E3 ubiquitin transferase n=1 Tax=Urochloa decumbens TaxID=240449 RepID=A0ABC9H4J8_9POAL